MPDLPKPERIVNMSFFPLSDQRSAMLTVAVEQITENDAGLKLVPHKEVVFAIGTVGNPVDKQFALMPSMARDLAKRIIEFCDFIEKSEPPKVSV